MKTKGITTPEEIEMVKSKTEYGTQEYEELKMKSMIVSCFCYDSMNINDEYIVRSGYKLSTKVFKEVYEEQSEFLKKNYNIIRGVYTDFEGCTYNTIHKITE